MHFFPIRWAKITKHWQNTKHTYLTIWTEDVYRHNSIFVHTSHKPCTVMVYYNNLSCQNFSILPPNHFLIVIVVLETFKSYTLKVFIRYHGSFFTTQWENSLVSNVNMFFNVTKVVGPGRLLPQNLWLLLAGHNTYTRLSDFL